MNLVTGSTGLIGSHLMIDLLEKGETVRALVRENSDTSLIQRVFDFYNKAELFKKIEWCKGDVIDVPSLEEAMNEISVVYHCAAVVSFHPKDEEQMFKVNVEGTANVVNTALESSVELLVYVSSVAALGRTMSGDHITEKAGWKSGSLNTKYAISKNAAENEVWRGMEEGLDAVIVNPGMVIGPGDKNRSSGALLGKVESGLRFYPPGTNGFVDVRDVSKCMIRLVENRILKERFIIVSENLKFKEVLSEIARAFDKKPPSVEASPSLLKLAWKAMWIWEKISGKKAMVTRDSVRASPHDFYYDNSRVKEATGIEFIPVKDAVKNAVAFARQDH